MYIIFKFFLSSPNSCDGIMMKGDMDNSNVLRFDDAWKLCVVYFQVVDVIMWQCVQIVAAYS